MSQCKQIDGKFYRIRRGKLVQIPDEWVGVFASRQTIRKRPSKLHRKVRRAIQRNFKIGLEWVDGRYEQIDEDA